ncbi:MAG: mycofactocin-associated electron transfer flavoprotein alpha subunit [Microthrixaceae bacterium]|nr:mycofactocin-associated electron transfer flavoprotein alpha subunit [Microthrixaceae bacterium]
MSGSALAADAVAVLAVRGGELPIGADECVAEAGGVALLVGDGLADAAAALVGAADEVWTLDWVSAWSTAGVAARLAAILAGVDVVVTPATPDGRDLAPHLALALGRPLFAGAISVGPTRVVQHRHEGRSQLTTAPAGPLVATLTPGVRSVPAPEDVATEARPVAVPASPVATSADAGSPAPPELVAIHPPDASTMDLSEATSILGGGAGLGGRDEFELLARVAAAMGASVGATRVVTDQGTLGHERQIGTTGVVVDPDRYLAFGISGAVQHTAGLGNPDLIVSVNTDPHSPMMAMADLALTADAPATLRALARALGIEVAEDPT